MASVSDSRHCDASDPTIDLIEARGGSFFWISRNDVPEQFVQLQRITGLALPDRQDLPSSHPQCPIVVGVALDVPRELLAPEVGTRSGRGCIRTTFVSMPEAPVDKDDAPELRQDYIRAPWEQLAVQLKAEASRVKISSDGKLGAGVLPLDAAHHARSGFGINDVCQM